MVHLKLLCFSSQRNLELEVFATVLALFFAKHRGFKLRYLTVRKNVRILESRNLELSRLTKIAEGTEVGFYFQTICNV